MLSSAYKEGFRDARSRAAYDSRERIVLDERSLTSSIAILATPGNLDSLCKPPSPPTGAPSEEVDGGALPYKATSKRVVYKNTKRVVYKGVRGGSYIKVNGKFVNIRNLKL